mmetsp:Transcript_953/g.2412  ORF Transcript_953/g.2412 Transcript_953/m.2412 type:complete len:177 (-) Transcript_953:159-689(-)
MCVCDSNVYISDDEGTSPATVIYIYIIKMYTFQTTLETFLEGDEPYYEFPPAQSLNRRIIEEQAEEKELVPFSVGDDKTGERRVFVFRTAVAPNELERRFLSFGHGSVADLMQRRAEGDDFAKYNQKFTLNNVKTVPKVRARKADGGGDDDELESRVVQDRTNFNLDRSSTLRRDH